MAKDKWTKVAKESQLEPGKPIEAEVGDGKVLVVKLADGRLHACGGECTHYGGPLAEGLLVGEAVTCPWHNARFHVPTGLREAPPAVADEPRYKVRVEGGEVQVALDTEPELTMPKGKDKRTFLIVGGGAAGQACAEALRRGGFAGKLVMLTPEDHVPYDRPALSKAYMSGDLDAKKLPLRPKSFYKKLEIDLRHGTAAKSLDAKAKKVKLDGGKTIAFDQCLLATGGRPRSLDLEGMGLDGCFTLRSRSDAEAIVKRAKKAEAAVVLGASFIGMETAASLRARDIDVHVVAPEDVPFARVFGDRVGGWFRKRHERSGVTFHLGQTAERIRGAKHVEGVRLADGTDIDCDLVIVGVGIEPAVDWLEDSGLAEDGAVPVDKHLRTSAEGIYAAGDIALVPSAATGEVNRIEHWIVAQRQGLHAAVGMLGRREPYTETPFFWTRQFGTSVQYIGHAERFDRQAVRGDLDGDAWLVGYYQGSHLRAAAAVGMSRAVMAIDYLLRRGIAVPPEQLEDESVDLEAMIA